MSVHAVVPTGPLTRLALGLVFSALTLSASDAAAQEQAAATSDYRLTMPVLRKAFAALYAANGDSLPGPKRRLPERAAMTIEQVQAELEGVATMQPAAAAQGITMRELAQVIQAWFQAVNRMTQEAFGTATTPLSPGVLRDNVAFLRQHEAEIQGLVPQKE